jgi:hypothetical protein
MGLDDHSPIIKQEMQLLIGEFANFIDKNFNEIEHHAKEVMENQELPHKKEAIMAGLALASYMENKTVRECMNMIILRLDTTRTELIVPYEHGVIL